MQDCRDASDCMVGHLEEEFTPQKEDRKAYKGIRSGNTFRSSGRSYVRRYLKEGFVLAQTRGNPTIPEEMSELGIAGDMVPFTLNKKGRWKIASMAKDFIEAGLTDFEDGTRVEVVERHKVLRKRQFCVSVHSNSVSPRCQTPSGGHYLHYDAVPIPRTRKTPRPPPLGKNTPDCLGVADEDDDCSQNKDNEDFIDVEIPEVVYDVVSPCPASSSLLRSRKHISRASLCLEDDDQPTYRRRRKDKEKERRAIKNCWKTLIKDQSMESKHKRDFDVLDIAACDPDANEMTDPEQDDKDEETDKPDNYAKILLRKQMKRRRNQMLQGEVHNAVIDRRSEVPMQKQVNNRQIPVLREEKHPGNRCEVPILQQMNDRQVPVLQEKHSDRRSEVPMKNQVSDRQIPLLQEEKYAGGRSEVPMQKQMNARQIPILQEENRADSRSEASMQLQKNNRENPALREKHTGSSSDVPKQKQANIPQNPVLRGEENTEVQKQKQPNDRQIPVLAEEKNTDSNSEVLRQKRRNDIQDQVLPEERHMPTEMGGDTNIHVKDEIPQSTVQTSDILPTAFSPKTQRLLPVPVLLTCRETQPSALRARLGSRYTEASCRPRKFLVNISQSVRDLLNSSKALAKRRGQQLDTTAFLVFTESEDVSSSGSDKKVLRVSLNMALQLDSIRIKTILDNESSSVGNIISMALLFISKLPVGCFVKKSFQSELSPVQKGVEAVDANEGLLTEALAQTSAIPRDELSTCKVCHKCYDDVEYCEGGVPGTSLFCGHWFCDACWREHLLSRIQDGASKLVCPAYDCDVSVDAATALTLVSVERVETHLNQRASRTDAAGRAQ